jgi:uncharacterized membrane protein
MFERFSRYYCVDGQDLLDTVILGFVLMMIPLAFVALCVNVLLLLFDPEYIKVLKELDDGI